VSSNRLQPGDVVLVRFPSHRPSGHKQEGQRPAVVVGWPDVLGTPRFPIVFVVPLTADRSQPWMLRQPRLYPRIGAGSGGLPRPSIALLDQTRALDLGRVRAYIGTLATGELRPLLDGLQRVFDG
jgi:mRNA interferase MazF